MYGKAEQLQAFLPILFMQDILHTKDGKPKMGCHIV